MISEPYSFMLMLVLVALGAYFAGRGIGVRKGYEKGKEMWSHPSEPVPLDRVEADRLTETVNSFGYDYPISIQKRELDRGGVAWFIEVPEYGDTMNQIEKRIKQLNE